MQLVAQSRRYTTHPSSCTTIATAHVQALWFLQKLRQHLQLTRKHNLPDNCHGPVHLDRQTTARQLPDNCQTTARDQPTKPTSVTRRYCTTIWMHNRCQHQATHACSRQPVRYTRQPTDNGKRGTLANPWHDVIILCSLAGVHAMAAADRSNLTGLSRRVTVAQI